MVSFPHVFVRVESEQISVSANVPQAFQDLHYYDHYHSSHLQSILQTWNSLTEIFTAEIISSVSLNYIKTLHFITGLRI